MLIESKEVLLKYWLFTHISVLPQPHYPSTNNLSLKFRTEIYHILMMLFCIKINKCEGDLLQHIYSSSNIAN